MSDKLVFLCGARDFHAMDWYKSAKELLPEKKIYILTDLIAGEGFKKIVTDEDVVVRMVILDRFLFRGQSRIGNIWRNILKLLVFPFQVRSVKRFAKKNPGAVYHAHAMYYLFLARAAGVAFVGTPQGSDVLVKPYRSKIFRHYAVKSMQAAKAVTVDSEKMKEKVRELAGIDAHIIQNGIDISSIYAFMERQASQKLAEKSDFLSIRGMAPLYRIKELVLARNVSAKTLPLKFIYPFYENDYKNEVFSISKQTDEDLGRVNRDEMYRLLNTTKLVFSIPVSDSSPRSVYEAIFCNCAVVITHHPYYDVLPFCMKQRIIIANFENERWFDEAVDEADRIIQTPYVPSEQAMDMFDQKRSFKRMEKLLFDL